MRGVGCRRLGDVQLGRTPSSQRLQRRPPAVIEEPFNARPDRGGMPEDLRWWGSGYCDRSDHAGARCDRAFDGLIGVEDECPRDRRQREIEGDVEEDQGDEMPMMPHVIDSSAGRCAQHEAWHAGGARDVARCRPAHVPGRRASGRRSRVAGGGLVAVAGSRGIVGRAARGAGARYRHAARPLSRGAHPARCRVDAAARVDEIVTSSGATPP